MSLRYFALDKDGCFIKVDTNCIIVQNKFFYTCTNLFRIICIICKCMYIYYCDELLIFFLKLYPVSKCPHKMTNMEFSCRAVASKNTLFHKVIIQERENF